MLKILISLLCIPFLLTTPDTAVTREIKMNKYGSTLYLGDEELVWQSNDPEVAYVVDNVVISDNPGRAVVSALTEDGGRLEVNIEVTDDKRLITNDRFFTDTEGNPIFSQGGGIFKFDDTYYWYGVRYAESVNYVNDPLNAKKLGNNLSTFEAYTCYTSKDLVNWEYRGDVATKESLSVPWVGWAGRCGVVYHEKTDKYILVSQLNGVIIARSDSPLGPFEKVKHYDWSAKIPGIKNGSTGDQTMFTDDDGKAYMICSSVNGRAYQYVIPMREEDYCDFDLDNIHLLYKDDKSYYDEDGKVAYKDKGGIEGNCMFRYKGNYYYTGSDLYGWNASRVYVLQSEDIMGDYNIQPTGQLDNKPYIMRNVKDNYAHTTQTGFYYTIKGSKEETVIYCGDRWSSFAVNGIGFNQWVPLSFDGKTPVFNNLSQWRLDAETGEWSVGEGNNYVNNSFFDADRVIKSHLTGWECSGNVSNKNSKRYSGSFTAFQSGESDYKATLKQKITNLPDGKYTLRAGVKSSGGQKRAVMYCRIGDTEYTKDISYEMNEWKDIVLSDIPISGGECEIGFFSDAYGGNWIEVDDVYLTKNVEVK